MTVIEIQFTMPGEGCNIDGSVVTADTPIINDQLEYMPGTPHYFARLRREAQDGHGQRSTA